MSAVFGRSYLIDFSQKKSPQVRKAKWWERLISVFKNLENKYFISNNDFNRISSKIIGIANPLFQQNLVAIRSNLCTICSKDDITEEQRQVAGKINAFVTILDPILVTKPSPEQISVAIDTLKTNLLSWKQHAPPGLQWYLTNIEMVLEVATKLQSIDPEEVKLLVAEICKKMNEIPTTLSTSEQTKWRQDLEISALTKMHESENFKGHKCIHDLLKSRDQNWGEDEVLLTCRSQDFAKAYVEHAYSELKSKIDIPETLENEKLFRGCYTELSEALSLLQEPPTPEVQEVRDLCLIKLKNYDSLHSQEKVS